MTPFIPRASQRRGLRPGYTVLPHGRGPPWMNATTKEGHGISHARVWGPIDPGTATFHSRQVRAEGSAVGDAECVVVMVGILRVVIRHSGTPTYPGPDTPGILPRPTGCVKNGRAPVLESRGRPGQSPTARIRGVLASRSIPGRHTRAHRAACYRDVRHGRRTSRSDGRQGPVAPIGAKRPVGGPFSHESLCGIADWRVAVHGQAGAPLSRCRVQGARTCRGAQTENVLRSRQPGPRRSTPPSPALGQS
jgi:hypothetical protein